jgi:hypothetical protein
MPAIPGWAYYESQEIILINFIYQLDQFDLPNCLPDKGFQLLLSYKHAIIRHLHMGRISMAVRKYTMVPIARGGIMVAPYKPTNACKGTGKCPFQSSLGSENGKKYRVHIH